MFYQEEIYPMLRKIDHYNGVAVALDETDRRVFIQESISFIYQVAKGEKHVTFKPIDYRETEILEEIENYLRGSSQTNMDIINTIVIRYGWIDKRLEKLEFIDLVTFMAEIRSGKPRPETKRKLTAVCKQLSLSMKKVKK